MSVVVTPDNSPPVVVDNSLGALERLYSSNDPGAEVFAAGVKFVQQYGHSAAGSRLALGKLRKAHGEGRTVDAVIKAMIFEPDDPMAWIREDLQRAERSTPIPKDWTPPPEWVENAIQPVEHGGHGIPLDLIRKARDTFVVWFTHTGIPHHDWLEMFRRWCVRDWERAQFNRAAYLKRLASTAGLGEFVHFQT